MCLCLWYQCIMQLSSQVCTIFTVIWQLGCPINSLWAPQSWVAELQSHPTTKQSSQVLVDLHSDLHGPVTPQPSSPLKSLWTFTVTFMDQSLHNQAVLSSPCGPSQWPSWTSLFTTKQSFQVLVDLHSDLHGPVSSQPSSPFKSLWTFTVTVMDQSLHNQAVLSSPCGSSQWCSDAGWKKVGIGCSYSLRMCC
jgi:hypothetical protein